MGTSQGQICSQIIFISEYYVKPKNEVEASKQPYFLGIVDTGCLPAHQIQKGLLFPTKPKYALSDFVEKLKNALSTTLVHFYPLAGRLETKIYPDAGTKWVYLDCNKGPGARIIYASVDLNVSDIMSSVDVHPIVKYMFDQGEEACNHDGHIRPLLSIQVTELLDGIFIGFTMNHSIVDGTSQWNFINTLSEVIVQLDNDCENSTISIFHKPIFKPFFSDGYGPILKLPYNPQDDKVMSINYQGPIRERIFHFSSTMMSKLKANANKECGVQNISSFQALSAFVWKSITRARNLQPDEETAFGVAMDARRRLIPPLSSSYFGNFITRGQTIRKAGDILSNELGWTSMAVHEVVVSQDDTAIRQVHAMLVKFICEAPTDNPFVSPNLVIVGGSHRFNMYGPEFGFGKAVAVLAGYSNKRDGKVTASPGREGDGSVDLEICLKPETMNALESDEEFMSFVTLV